MALPYDPRRTALYTPERESTLFSSGVSHSPVQLAVEAARLAYHRAEQSAEQLQRLTQALARAGFAAPAMFADGSSGAAAFGSVHASDGVALLALRGTQPDDFRDIRTDLAAVLVAWPESAGRVHAGFAGATRALLPQIQAWIGRERVDVAKLIVTGHSLGGAMAMLVASLLRPDWLVTLGCPRVGDAAFIATVGAANMMRIVDCCDLVTRAPPPVGGYTHPQDFTYLTRKGRVVMNPGRGTMFADRVAGRASYLVRHAWKVTTNVLVRDLADHAPRNYARGFF